QGERIAALMDRLGVPDDEAIENKAVSKTLESAQKRVEGYHYDTRKNVVQYDNVINRHRKVVYKVRREILEGENIKPEIDKLIEARLRELTIVPAKNNPKFKAELEAIIPLSAKVIARIGSEKNDKKRFDMAVEATAKFYASKEEELGEDIMRGVEREVYLQVLDVLWMQHLENMQHLREGIHWRSVGQRDPLVEYRSESQKLFESLQRTLQDEVLRAIMHVRLSDINQATVTDEKYESELTAAAGNSVEQGVNEAGAPTTRGDQDFKVKKSQAKAAAAKKKTKKKRKAARSARKRH
ncbi:MAG TPA: preprotein translocase subunit SecA, partial [Candidatus Saccharimonadales bacterium]|nr:preprotein translocase subunit SecA [Candidatus Saccharimonadales bacterium]